MAAGACAGKELTEREQVRAEVAAVEDDYPFDETDVFDRRDFPRMAFIEHRYAGDPTNWWVPNRAAMEAMLRSSGLRIDARIGDEIYYCSPVSGTVGSGTGAGA